MPRAKGTIQINITCPPGLKRRAEAEAARQEKTLAEWLRDAMRAKLARETGPASTGE